MNKHQWSDEEIEIQIEMHLWDTGDMYCLTPPDVYELATSIRDDLQRQLDRRTKTARRLLECNAELRAQLAAKPNSYQYMVEGWIMHYRGQSLSDCPYDAGSPQGQLWAKGWQWRETNAQNEKLQQRIAELEQENERLRAQAQGGE